MGKSTINGNVQELFVCLPEGKQYNRHLALTRPPSSPSSGCYHGFRACKDYLLTAHYSLTAPLRTEKKYICCICVYTYIYIYVYVHRETKSFALCVHHSQYQLLIKLLTRMYPDFTDIHSDTLSDILYGSCPTYCLLYCLTYCLTYGLIICSDMYPNAF